MESSPPDHDRNDADDASQHDEDAFDVARVLRVAVVLAAIVSGFAAAHGVLVTLQHLAADIPTGTIARVEPARGGYRITLEGGRVAHLPSDILETTAGRAIQLKPGMAVSKAVGSLTYVIAGESRGGMVWALRQWLLPARVTLPLVIYFVLSWLLVFRASEHRRHIAIEALVVPLVRWMVIAVALFILLSLVLGCAVGCGRLMMRMSG